MLPSSYCQENITLQDNFIEMRLFVEEASVVRRIWGRSDTILFIFAGASAEFALNKAVDWLYFTGKLPGDPLARMFSTLGYARRIVFSSYEEAHRAIDGMRHIHTAVEESRGASIPDWAYRDVLYMLIYYSIAAYELLDRRLTPDEKEEVYNVFYRVGTRMGVKALPQTYIDWLPQREAQLVEDLKWSEFTADLLGQYRKHLGVMRYRLLTEGQKLIVPDHVRQLLQFSVVSWLTPAVPLYKLSRLIRMDQIFTYILLPPAYRNQLPELNVHFG